MLPSESVTAISVNDSLGIEVCWVAVRHVSELVACFLPNSTIVVCSVNGCVVARSIVNIAIGLQRNFQECRVFLLCATVCTEDECTMTSGTNIYANGICTIRNTNYNLLAIVVQCARCAVVRVEVAMTAFVRVVILSACRVLVTSTSFQFPTSFSFSLWISDKASIIGSIWVLGISVLLLSLHDSLVQSFHVFIDDSSFLHS